MGEPGSNFISCAAASALRFLRLRRHSRVTPPINTRIMTGTIAAAAYTGALSVPLSDHSHPEGRPPYEPMVGDDDAPVVVGKPLVIDNNRVESNSGYGVSVRAAVFDIDISQGFVVAAWPPYGYGGQGSVEGYPSGRVLGRRLV